MVAEVFLFLYGINFSFFTYKIMKELFSNSSVIAKLLVLLGISLISAVFFTVIFGLIAGTDISNAMTLRVLQSAQTIGAFLVPSFVLAYIYSTDSLQFLYLKKTTKGTNYLYVVLLTLAVIPLINLLGDLNSHLVLPEWLSGVETWMKATEQQTEELMLRMLNVETVNGLCLNILVIALLPAIGEELMFRGALMRIFQHWKNKHVAVWVAAIIFSAIHFQFYGFLPRMVLGACFGYMLLWTGSLLPAIVAHFLNNAVIIIVYYLNHNGFIGIDADSLGSGSTWWVGIISGAIALLLLVLMKKKQALSDE